MFQKISLPDTEAIKKYAIKRDPNSIYFDDRMVHKRLTINLSLGEQNVRDNDIFYLRYDSVFITKVTLRDMNRINFNLTQLYTDYITGVYEVEPGFKRYALGGFFLAVFFNY